MHYIIVASILFLTSFHTFQLFSKEADFKMLAGNAAPMAAKAPDSTYISELKSKSAFIHKDSFQRIEDTILPPCDIIFFKSGKIDYCKIVEVTPTNISYKMCDYLDGPSIVVNKSTVHKIRYANGKEEIVISEQQATPNAYVQARKDPLSKLALIFSLCGLLISIFALAGLILGIISLSKIERSKGALRGKGTAIWAIVISTLIIILVISTI